MSVGKVSEKVRYLLWAKSAGRCQYEGCNKALWRDGLTKIEMNFAEVAHIIGSKRKSPRGDPTLPEEYTNDVGNLMLLCLDHHEMIDEILEKHSDDELRRMKRLHEQRIELATEISPNKSSQVVIYRGNVGDHTPSIEYKDAVQAMFPDRYPATPWANELSMINSAYQDHEDEFWRIQVENLERQFAARIMPLIQEVEENHFSVFAFAPQPLLIKLGTLLSDIYPAEVYQLHREPPTWEWRPNSKVIEFQITRPRSLHRAVALILSLSATITNTRITEVMGDLPYSIWRMDIESPNQDFVQDRWQLALFKREFRMLLDRVKAQHGEDAIIYLFPSVPVSVAVEIGRVWQSKADLPIEIYDQNRKLGGFVRAISIGE